MRRGRDHNVVARAVEDVNDRPMVWGLFHHPSPTSDYRYVRRSRKQLCEPPGDIPDERSVGLARLGGQAHVSPFVGSSPKNQISPDGLVSVESVPRNADVKEWLQGGGRQYLHPCRRHGNVNAHQLRHQRGLGPGSSDHYIGHDVAGGRLNRRDPAIDDLDARDGRVLIEPASQVLKGPCECLDRQLGIGVPAVGGKDAA